MPLFSADYYFDPPTSIDYAVKHLQIMSEKNVTSQTNISNIFDAIQWTHTEARVLTPLVFLSAPFTFVNEYKLEIYENLREDEKDAGSYDVNKDLYSENHPGQVSEIANLETLSSKDGGLTILGVVNKRKLSIASAGLSFGRTIFVCIVLTTGALMFSKDGNFLSIYPTYTTPSHYLLLI